MYPLFFRLSYILITCCNYPPALLHYLSSFFSSSSVLKGSSSSSSSSIVWFDHLLSFLSPLLLLIYIIIITESQHTHKVPPSKSTAWFFIAYFNLLERFRTSASVPVPRGQQTLLDSTYSTLLFSLSPHVQTPLPSCCFLFLFLFFLILFFLILSFSFSLVRSVELSFSTLFLSFVSLSLSPLNTTTTILAWALCSHCLWSAIQMSSSQSIQDVFLPLS